MGDVESVLAELHRIQESAGSPRGVSSDFDRARALIEHPDNDCRWQALIAVGEWIWSPEHARVWDVVLEHGRSEDADLRMGVACVLLEHLLEHHFEVYFPLLRRRLREGAPRLAQTFRSCWCFFDDDDPRQAEFRRLQDECAAPARALDEADRLAGVGFTDLDASRD